ncbi:hypothetical protein VKT23_017701 [Stygiomarasmius scandens]|uniref:NAD(P)-binding protein n=1 Tax=Marasmiellus scandens TaxID=2682957 RepID=A0ABR1ISM7_9AGAR
MPIIASHKSSLIFQPSKQTLPVAVFVGGTSGTGQGIVEAFGRHTRGNAHIFLIGRNKAAAEHIISSLPKPSCAEIRHKFIQCDVSLMSNVSKVSQDLLQQLPDGKLNYLVMSPGYFSLNGLEESAEGIGRIIALCYYARFKFTIGLLPALEKAQQRGEDAKVLSVLLPGRGVVINSNDLGVKKDYTPFKALGTAATYTDLAFQKLSITHPSMTFIHAFPGTLVRTKTLSDSGTPFLRMVAPAFKLLSYPFSISTETAGENMLHIMLHCAKQAGFHRIGARGENLDAVKGRGIIYEDEKLQQMREVVWTHSLEATKTA